MPCGLSMETNWCIAEPFIVQMGWNADHKPCNQCQMLICVNSEAGCLRKHIRMQAEGQEQTPETSETCILYINFTHSFFCFSLSSRRRLYEEKTPSRPMSSSPLNQSPRHDARMVSSLPHFRLSGTPLHFPCILALRFDKSGFQIYRSLRGSCDDTLKY